MSNNFKTKIRLSNNKVYQDSGDILTLSGDTTIKQSGNIILEDEQTHFTEDGDTNLLGTLKSIRQNVTKYVSQNAHGFYVGDVVGIDPSDGFYKKVSVNKIKTSGYKPIGIISRRTVDSNNFVVTQSGFITGLAELTPGSTYYIDETTDGTLREGFSGSTDNYPILIAKTAETGWVLPYTGISENSSVEYQRIGDNTNTITIPNPFPNKRTLRVNIFLVEPDDINPLVFDLIPVEVAWKHVITETTDNIVIEFDYVVPTTETYNIIITR